MSQLGIPFEETIVPFSSAPGENWENYRRFSPNGKVPCLVDNGISVWDSLAIVEYLAESHPEIWPQERQPRAWARSACAEMHSGFSTLRNTCPMNVGIRVRMNQPPEALKKELEHLCELWESGLAQFGGPFLAGHAFTAVDAFFVPVAFRIQSYGLELTPESTKYVQRLLGLQSVMMWEEEALKEEWRDESHEKETLESGILLQDLRCA